MEIGLEALSERIDGHVNILIVNKETKNLLLYS